MDVEAAGKAKVDRRLAAGRDDVGVDARPILADAGGADVGRRLRAVGHDVRPGVAGGADEQPRRRVVEVDDRRGGHCPWLLDAATLAQAVEERQLGVAIRLPRPVELEMLVGDVREDRDVVDDADHAIERKRVGGRLDDRRLIAGIDHRPQRGLQLGRLGRRRVLGVIVGLTADPGRDRPDHPGPDTRCLECRDGQVRGRGLAVGARDADDRQLA